MVNRPWRGFWEPMRVSDLFTANLKKSVTMTVDPLSVMGFWAVLDIVAVVAQELSFNLFVPWSQPPRHCLGREQQWPLQTAILSSSLQTGQCSSSESLLGS